LFFSVIKLKQKILTILLTGFWHNMAKSNSDYSPSLNDLELTSIPRADRLTTARVPEPALSSE
jgi:hypothetical protein